MNFSWYITDQDLFIDKLNLHHTELSCFQCVITLWDKPAPEGTQVPIIIKNCSKGFDQILSCLQIDFFFF